MQEKLSSDDSSFVKKMGRYVASLSPISHVFQEQYRDISELFDAAKIQESCSVRNVLRARTLADLLIDTDGTLLVERIPQLISQLQENLYVLGAGFSHDTVRNAHILHALSQLQESKELQRSIQNISRPYSNTLAEAIIRNTLCVPRNTPITDVYAKKACLAAWFTYLRQSLGSCFATAPAILVQQEQPLVFLKDLEEMLYTGSLKRVFGGVEYSVPMSTSWGNGDIKKPIVLQRFLEASENKIWMSYGMIVGFETVGLIESSLQLKDKVTRCFEIIQEIFPALCQDRHLFLTDVEEIFRYVLLRHYGISKEDVDDFTKNAKNTFFAPVQLVTTFAAPKKHDKQNLKKNDLCAAFLQDMEDAIIAFKALADTALLKSWEFTIASFSEIKLDFARYNLYTSLGVNFDDVGGIGECLYKLMSLKVEQANTTLRSLADEYEQAAIPLRYIEQRLRSASTEREIEWIQAEYRSKQVELYHIEQQRDIAHEKASKIAHLHEFLLQEYDKKFCHYFQEVYDAEIHDISSGPFDDSPAGFRLLYKHGRNNPSQWTYIRSLSEFVDALVSFFTITEREIQEMPQIKGIEQEFSVMITQLVHHVRSDEFLESSFSRMARAYGVRCPKKPLEHLDSIEKKPWVYTSGGSMSTLVSAYFRSEQKPFEITRWVESPIELFAWIIDSLRQLPERVARAYIENPNKIMLIHSPTHAFCLKPGFSPLRESWTSDVYSYSWIKQHVLEPAKKYYEQVVLDVEMIHHISRVFLSQLPENYKPRCAQVMNECCYRQNIQDFRSYISHILLMDRGLQSSNISILSQSMIDSVLYAEVPFFDWDHVQKIIIETIVVVFGFESNKQTWVQEQVSEQWKRFDERKYVSRSQLISLVQGFILFFLKKNSCKKDFFMDSLNYMRKQSYLGPQPILFADTNWITDFFSFVVNPGTLEIDFWSFDFYGVSGRPVEHWKQWLDGSRKEPAWGIYTKPHEYVA